MPSMAGTSAGSPAPTATHVERSIDPTLFAGKVFHIAPGLFKEYEDKLKADIKLAGGSHTDSMWESDYVLHNPPSSHKKWHQDLTNRRRSAGEPGSALLIPTIRPYHWFYTCIHARPSRIVDTAEPEYSSRPILLHHEKHLDHNGVQLEITRPVKIYCTVNMPILSGESSCAEALENVVARLEANGAWRSPKRGTADILILNQDFESGKKFAREARPEQTVEHRYWLDNMLDKKARYVRGQPTAGIKKKPKVEVQADQSKASGSATGAGDKVPKASGSAAGDKVWIQKPSVPFKGPGGRTEFTREDEDKVLRWLMYHHPEKTNWKSRSIYQELCDHSHKKHLEWADRHTPQSWHERVRKRFSAFSARSAQYAGANVGLDRQLRTRAERAASAGTGGTGGETVEEGKEEYVRSWMQDNGKEMSESGVGVGRSTAKGKGKSMDKAKGKGRAMMDENQDQDDTDSFAASEDATVNGKRKRADKAISEQPEGVGAGPTQKRTKQTNAAVDDEAGRVTVTAPRPIAVPEAEREVPNQIDVVAIEETQIVSNDIVMEPESRPVDGSIRTVAQGEPSAPAEAEESFVTATGDENQGAEIDQAVTKTTTVFDTPGNDNDQDKGEARAISQTQDQEMAIETARIVIDAVTTAFGENFEADGSMPAPTQHSVAELDGMESFDLDDEDVGVKWKENLRKVPLVAKVGEEERVAEHRQPGKTKDKRLSTLSERQVNEMVLDEEEEGSTRSEIQVGPTVARAPILESAAVPSEQTEQQVAPAPHAVEPSVVPSAVPLPPPVSTTTGTDLNPRRRATSTVSKSRRPVQTPERAAHIISQTTAKFGCDVRTVINAMQYVLKRDPEKSIPLKELWRVMAEDQKDGFKVFGSKV